MSAHTPGEWYTKREGFSTVYVMSRIGGGWIQEVAACGPTEQGADQQEANARLIAAAPALLGAMKDMLAGWRYIRECHGDLYGVGWDRAEQAAAAAIAKATGSQP